MMQLYCLYCHYFLLVVQLFNMVYSAESIITVPPVDTIGCYGGISTFYCESNRSDVLGIYWNINGNSITEQDKETHGITINNDNSLSIMGLPINNGISIGCSIVVSTPPYIETTGATFTVTDPSPIHNLTIQFNNDIMTCTWSQPSCVPVNYSYHVNINNESLIVTNTTTIQYTVSFCQSYTVSVTVMDTIQPQYQSETITGTSRGVLDIQLVGSPIVIFDTPEVCNITLPISVNMTNIPSSCQIKLSEIFTQYVPDDDTMNGEYILSDRLESYNNTTGMGMFSFEPYDERLKGNYLLSPQSIPGTSIESNPLDFNISTFNVQNFSITPLSDGTTNITCVFAINSFADGCIVVFTSNTNIAISVFVAKSDDSHTATSNVIITNNNYHVTVYDIINGVIGQYQAYTVSDIHIIHYTETMTTSSILSTSSTGLTTILYNSTMSLLVSTSTPLVTIPIEITPSLQLISISAGVVLILIIIVMVIIIIGQSLYYRYYQSHQSCNNVNTVLNPSYENPQSLIRSNNRNNNIIELDNNPAYSHVNIVRTNNTSRVYENVTVY